jgi:hypothetical protein
MGRPAPTTGRTPAFFKQGVLTLQLVLSHDRKETSVLSGHCFRSSRHGTKAGRGVSSWKIRNGTGRTCPIWRAPREPRATACAVRFLLRVLRRCSCSSQSLGSPSWESSRMRFWMRFVRGHRLRPLEVLPNRGHCGLCAVCHQKDLHRYGRGQLSCRWRAGQPHRARLLEQYSRYLRTRKTGWRCAEWNGSIALWRPSSAIAWRKAATNVELTSFSGRRVTWEPFYKMRSCETRPNVDAKAGKLTCVNGDVWEGFVEFVDDEHQAVVFQPRSSPNPEKDDTRNCYVIRWDEIVDFQQLTD